MLHESTIENIILCIMFIAMYITATYYYMYIHALLAMAYVHAMPIAISNQVLAKLLVKLHDIQTDSM